MGREIRRVPPNFESDQPMYDQNFEDKFKEWLADFDRIRSGNLSEIETECYPNGLSDWLLDEGAPPDRKYYRTWKDEEAIWFQVWETVSEGTPVSPAFETMNELINYLAKNGDFWDQKRGDPPWGIETATRFCQSGWAPSFVFTPATGLVPGYKADLKAR